MNNLINTNKKKSITIIIPCYNENNNINELIIELNKVTKNISNIIFTYFFIDDGSSDQTFQVIKNLSRKNNKIQALRLTRNFGSHVAISAGIEHTADSNAIIVISSDLQEPPELITDFIKKWNEGYKVIWGIRKERSQSFFGKLFSNIFYSLFIKFSNLKNYPKEGPSCFFLLDKKIYVNWKKFKEKNRFVFGLISWMGYKSTSIKYKQIPRAHGKSSYDIFKLIKLAIDSIVSFSFLPIRIISYLGIVISLVSFFYASYLIINKIFFSIALDGLSQIIVIILLLGGIQLITLGIIGEYIWRGVDESRNRPLYIISEKINVNNKIDI